MSIQNVILVAGYNYENDRNPNFIGYSENRMARLLAKSKTPHEMVFTIFDVGGGVIKQNKADLKTRKRSWAVLKKFNPVTTANYEDYKRGEQNHFITTPDDDPAFKPDGIMSITDVYELVQTIGSGSEKQTVVELSFFSHGWAGGPILVNSFDVNAGDPSKKRLTNDHDSRQWKDFIAPTMDATGLANFKSAFASSAVIWIWGCSWNVAAHRVLSRLFKTSKFRGTPPAKIKDTDKFTLDFSEDSKHPESDDPFNTIVRKFLPGGTLKGHVVLADDGSTSGADYTVTKTFQEIKDALQARVDGNYSARIALVTDVDTFGALPGTYADGEKGVPLPLMIIPNRKPPYDDDLRATLNFYKTHMASTFDPENRGYGHY
jgi:hypothetical protein